MHRLSDFVICIAREDLGVQGESVEGSCRLELDVCSPRAKIRALIAPTEAPRYELAMPISVPAEPVPCLWRRFASLWFHFGYCYSLGDDLQAIGVVPVDIVIEMNVSVFPSRNG